MSVVATVGGWLRRDPGSLPSESDESIDDEWLQSDAAARRRYGAVTARNSGLCVCSQCGLLSKPPSSLDDPDLVVDCPRCAEPLHARKPASLAKVWAYIVSALILYIPANVFPISDTRTLFDDQKDTIFSSVVYLWQAGSWPLALLVFFASITVPLAKLVVLTGLAISVQRGSLRKPAQRTRLFRIVDFIGRWSMLDIFAVSILTALVQLQSLAQITAGPGVLAFGAVCVLTILAAHAFDPRLIWDPFDASDVDPDHEDD